VALKRVTEGADKRGKNLSRLFVCCCAALVLLLCGCASVSPRGQNEEVMAMVNGEPVTMGDLQYALQVAHRREDLAGAGTINVSDYMQKLINDALMVQEARVMGLDKTPAFLKAIDEYALRESVVRLHDEEVVQKVKLTEEDIVDFYKKNSEFFTLNYIVTDSEDKAGEALEKLKEGGDFEEVASEYSVRGNEEEEEETDKKTEGKHQIVVSRRSLANTPEIEEAVLAMKPGDTSGVIKSKEKYVIVMLVSRKEPDMKDLEKEHVRERIKKDAEKVKQEIRGDEYIAELREQAASNGQLLIDEEILSSIEFKEYTKKEKEQWIADERPLAEVYGKVLTVADFVKMAGPGKTKKEVLDNWISIKLVDREALSRHYEEMPELKEMIETYKKQLLKSAFIKKAIMPQIMVSEKLLMDYYSEHKESFAEDPLYKIQQITLNSMEDAQSVLEELKGGADFSWVAKNRSVDSSREAGGNLGWKTKGVLPVEAWDLLDSLEPGQLSPIISSGHFFIIIRMQGKEEGKIPQFGEIKGKVFNAYMQDKFSTLVDEYTAKLREGADIKINEKAVHSLQERFKGGP
jgi:peptidyl-prolyl cis-trans isomerase C